MKQYNSATKVVCCLIQGNSGGCFCWIVHNIYETCIFRESWNDL